MAQVNIKFQDVTQDGKTIKIISFEGQLDETNVDSEAQKIYKVIDEMAEPNLIFDFSGLEYMNSKSIGYVTDWYSRVMAKNGKIAIANPRVNIMDILKVVGISQIITIYDDIEKAKVAFAGAAVSSETPAAPPTESEPTATPPATPAA